MPFEAHATNEAILINLAKMLETAVNLHRTALPGDVICRGEPRLYPVFQHTLCALDENAFSLFPVASFLVSGGRWEIYSHLPLSENVLLHFTECVGHQLRETFAFREESVLVLFPFFFVGMNSNIEKCFGTNRADTRNGQAYSR